MGNAIRPFRVHFADEALADLERRIAATRWPTRATSTFPKPTRNTFTPFSAYR